MSKEVVRKTVYNKLNTKVNNLENKIPGANILIHISQYNTNKQSLEEKTKYFNKKISHVSPLVITTALNKKLS